MFASIQGVYQTTRKWLRCSAIEFSDTTRYQTELQLMWPQHVRIFGHYAVDETVGE
jgi:hypothetical protein